MGNTQDATITVNGVEYVRKDQAVKLDPNEVIVRTYSAGVHIGAIQHIDGKEVKLSNARRLWSWQGAFTLNAVAMDGVDRSKSRISRPVPVIILTEAIEIIPIAKGVDLSSTEV